MTPTFGLQLRSFLLFSYSLLSFPFSLCSLFPHPAPIVLALIVTCTYIEPFPCYLETLVSTSCLQVSPHVFRSVHTSLNTYTCLQSCLLSFAPAFTVHRVPALLPVSLSVPPPRSTAVVTQKSYEGGTSRSYGTSHAVKSSTSTTYSAIRCMSTALR